VLGFGLGLIPAQNIKSDGGGKATIAQALAVNFIGQFGDGFALSGGDVAKGAPKGIF